MAQNGLGNFMAKFISKQNPGVEVRCLLLQMQDVARGVYSVVIC